LNIFDENKTEIKTINDFKIKAFSRNYLYTGMVCKEKNKPEGFGRAVRDGGKELIEGQFKDGELHGYVRRF
jgi:hypothetical protein